MLLISLTAVVILALVILGEQHITDVKFKAKEMLPETKDQRGIIYDVFCETERLIRSFCK